MATTSLGRLTLDLVARTAGFTDGMTKAERSADKWRKNVERNAKIATTALAGAAAAAGAGMVALVKSQLQAADEASKMAQRIGVATEQLAGLQLAFELGRSSAEGMQTAMVKLADAAAGGNKAFEALGISVSDAQGHIKDSRSLIAEVADAFAAMPDGAQKTALAVDLFGRSGAQIIPILNAGAQGFSDMDAQAKALGLTLSTQAGKDIEAFNDRVSLMFKRFEGFGLQLTVAVLPYLHATMDALENLADFIGSHLNEMLLLGGAAFVSFAGSAGLAAGAIGMVGRAFKATAALFLTNPFGLVITAVAGLIVYLGQAEEALHAIKTVGAFAAQVVADTFSAAVGGISSAFSWLLAKLSRDWQQIVDVVSHVFGWIGDETDSQTETWTSGFDGFFDDTGSGFYGILEKAGKVFDSIGVFVRSSVTYIGQLMASLAQTVGNIWENIKKLILNAVEGFINGIIKGINKVNAVFGATQHGGVDLGGGELVNPFADLPTFSDIYDAEAANQVVNGFQAAARKAKQELEELNKSGEKAGKAVSNALAPPKVPPIGETGGAGGRGGGARRSSGGGRSGSSGIDQFAQLMQRMDEEAEKLRETIGQMQMNDGLLSNYTRLNELQIELNMNSERYKSLSAEQITMLKQQASAIDALKQQKALADYKTDNARTLADMEFEIELLGKTAEEVERLRFFREQDLKVKELSVGASADVVAALEAEAAAAKLAYEGIVAARAAREQEIRNQGFDWTTVFKETADNVKSYSEIMKDGAVSALGGIGNAFGELAATGKASFKDLAASVLQDMSRMLMQWAATQAAMGIFNSFSGGGSVFSRGASSALSALAMADGGAFAGGVQFFAQGGIVNQATAFRHAGGIGVMGEAGAEAIMPLARGKNGKLGVTLNGAGGQNVVINHTLIINQDGGSSSESDAPAAYKQLLDTHFDKRITDALRPGGSLDAAIKQRSKR